MTDPSGLGPWSMQWGLLWWTIVPLAAVVMVGVGWRWLYGSTFRIYTSTVMCALVSLMPVLDLDPTRSTTELTARGLAGTLVLLGIPIRVWRTRHGRRFYGDPERSRRPVATSQAKVGWPTSPPWQ